MLYLEARCPICGEEIGVPAGHESVYCALCGGKFLAAAGCAFAHVSQATEGGKPASALQLEAAPVQEPAVLTDGQVATASADAAASDVRAGDTYEFGRYPQTADGGEEPITWRVLEVRDGKALLISKKALAARPFHSDMADVNWEHSELRSWLNYDFRSEAFADDEIDRICQSVLPTEKTTDFLFLLSDDDARAYFDNDSQRTCEGTPYAKAHGLHVAKDSGLSHWWLRSEGFLGNQAAGVHCSGMVYPGGFFVDNASMGLRPSCWVRL